MSKVTRFVDSEWVELTNDQGRIYYANLNTKETRWDPPPRAASAANDAVSLVSSAPSEKILFGDWREIFDEKSGKPYFYNKVTKETRWERPIDPSTVTTLPPSSLPPSESARVQTSTGQILERVGGPGSNWVKVPDPKSGQHYYVNLQTKETSWTPPPQSSSPRRRDDDLLISTSPSAGRSSPPLAPLSSSLSSQPQIVNGVIQAGVGIFLEQREVGSPMYIKTVFKDSAADRSGKILVGDELVSVNGERVVGKTPTTLRGVIVGPQGTYCRCGFRRGNTEFEVKLIRGTGESLAALATRGLELHEELDSVRESLRLVEGELEEERRKRLAESNLRSELDGTDRSGWKEERRKLLDQLEIEQRARKDAEIREKRLLDERVQQALNDKERSLQNEQISSERQRVEQLLQLERQRAAEGELFARTKQEEIQKLQEQLRQLTDKSQDPILRNSLRQAEEREQGLLRALEQERTRYEDQLRSEHEKRIGEQGRRQASEEREQQLLRQLEDERFRWGEALRLEEQRARMANSTNTDEIMKQIQEREEALRKHSLAVAQQRFEEEMGRLESNLTSERARANAAVEREQKLLDELRQRSATDDGKSSQIENLRRALEEDRSKLEATLWELNDRLAKETEKRVSAERREEHLVEQLRQLRRNTSDNGLRNELDELKSRLTQTPAPPLPSYNPPPYNPSPPHRPLSGRGSERDGVAQTLLGIDKHNDIREEIAREKERLGISSRSSGPNPLISSAGSLSQPPPPPPSVNSVPNLVGLLTSKNPNTVRESAYALGLVAIESDGRSSVLALPQAVFRLENLLTSPDVGTVRYSALALGNMAMDSAGRKSILGVRNSIEHLATLLRSEDSETVRYAALALGNLVLEENGRTAVLGYAASVPHLCAQLQSSDKQTVRYATGAIRNIAVEESGRRAVTANPAAIQSLSLLQSSTDSATARYASAALKNLAIQ